MLIDKELKELGDKKEYIKVFNYFHEEYTDMMKQYLTRHEVKLNDDDCLINYIIKTRCFTPKNAGYTIPIGSMYSEVLPDNEKYEILVNSYPEVRNVFSK